MILHRHTQQHLLPFEVYSCLVPVKQSVEVEEEHRQRKELPNLLAPQSRIVSVLQHAEVLCCLSKAILNDNAKAPREGCLPPLQAREPPFRWSLQDTLHEAVKWIRRIPKAAEVHTLLH